MRTISLENAAYVTNVVKQARNNQMNEIAGLRRNQERSTPHNVITSKCHEHRMLDIMIECIASADAVESKPGSCRNEFRQAHFGRSEPALQVLSEVGPQGLRRQFGNVNTCTPSRVRNRLTQDSRTLGCLSPGYGFKRSEGATPLTAVRQQPERDLSRYKPCYRTETYPLVFA